MPTAHRDSSRGERCPSAIVVLAVACLALCGGCGTPRDPIADSLAEARGAIDREIADPPTAARLQLLITDFGILARERAADVARFRAAWRALNADYDATPEQFRRLDDDHEAARRAQRARFAVLQARFATELGDADWERLRRARSAALASLLASSPGLE